MAPVSEVFGAGSGGDVRWGAWSMLGHAPAAELLARSGCDWLVLDAQHGLYDDAAVVEALAVLPAPPTGPPVLVRVAEGSSVLVGRALDAGAAGVVVPLVETPEQAAEVAAACRYAPRGHRSWGALAGLRGREAPEPAAADAAVACVVMVETARALEQVEAIAATPGVDAVLVGPFDLSLTLGTTVDALLADTSPGAPLPRVVAACRAAGVPAAAFAADPARARRFAAHGFSAVVAGTDALLLAEAAAARVADLRG